jgi:hypothetical protein
MAPHATYDYTYIQYHLHSASEASDIERALVDSRAAKLTAPEPKALVQHRGWRLPKGVRSNTSALLALALQKRAEAATAAAQAG